MRELKEKARALIKEFKGNDYVFGINCLERIGEIAAPYGRKALLIASLEKRSPSDLRKIQDSLLNSGLEIRAIIPSSRPNSPKEDVLRIKEEILKARPDCLIVASGGSGIDTTKAAGILAVLGGKIEDYFGIGKVSEKLQSLSKKLLPLIAVQTASSSAAHLTKYSNITDTKTYQKKLIVDEAIIPPRALFDYSLTQTMSASFTSTGAADGLSHCLEVYYGARLESFQKIEEISLLGIELILSSLEKALVSPSDLGAREACGLATDLGGYAIMIGGTSGGHLTSFSLVDILSHGQASALMNPYYTVFFSPAIEKQLRSLAYLFGKYGLMKKVDDNLRGEALGLAVAQSLIEFNKRAGLPTTLGEIKGMSYAHIEKAIKEAQSPELEMKLSNMPIPLSLNKVEHFLRPILEAALSGDFNLILRRGS